jgi:uncharacterized protein (UPF0262 family)
MAGSLSDFRFDEATWQEASEPRRAEWKVLLAELVEDGVFDATLDGRYLLLTATTSSYLFEALDDDGVVRVAARLDASLLAESIREYAGIVRRLDGSGQHYDAAWFQAVDMAKKVVHDRAADILSRAIGTISVEQATLRRLFSILFSVRVDTAALRDAHRHRR